MVQFSDTLLPKIYKRGENFCRLKAFLKSFSVDIFTAGFKRGENFCRLKSFFEKISETLGRYWKLKMTEK